ncbi:MAG: molecular chaperone TorD family protein [Oligoflexia bacterium]|nr:molecular chaperone TorD family protein [Oligoflexia bacterium]
MKAQVFNPGPFVLASVITGYPDGDFKNAVTELLRIEDLEIPAELKTILMNASSDENHLDDLRSEYISIFDHSKALNPLYETEYGRERAMFKANGLSDIAGFYRAFGFEINEESGREMIDHISVELEFYSLLLMKLIFLKESNDQEGVEVVEDGMRKFLTDHLGKFVPSILDREGTRSSNFYSQVFSWVNDLIQKECIRVGASPEVVDWFDARMSDEEVSCGGSAK